MGGTSARSPGVGDYFFQLVFLLVLLARMGFLFARCLSTFFQSVAGVLYGRANGTGVSSASWLVFSGRGDLLGFFMRYIKLDILEQSRSVRPPVPSAYRPLGPATPPPHPQAALEAHDLRSVTRDLEPDQYNLASFSTLSFFMFVLCLSWLDRTACFLLLQGLPFF